MNLTKEEIEVINSLLGDKCLVMTLIYRYIFTYYNRERVYTTNPEALPPDVLRERYYKKELAA